MGGMEMAAFTIPTFEGPALVGSEKQIAWATKIRNEKMWLAGGYQRSKDAETFAKNWSMAKKTLYTDYTARAVVALGAHASAAWWIEHRDDPIDILVEDERRALFATMTIDEKAAIKAL